MFVPIKNSLTQRQDVLRSATFKNSFVCKGTPMKLSLFIFSFLFTVGAQAGIHDVTVQCKRSLNVDCTSHTFVSFQKLGCYPLPNSVRCHDAAMDPQLDPSYHDKVKGYDFCSIQSACHEPTYGSFGQVSCNLSASGEKEVDLRRVSSSVTLTVSAGLFQRMVSKLCK